MRAFDRRVIAERVDDQTMLMSFGVQDTILKSAFLTQGSYYFIAVVDRDSGIVARYSAFQTVLPSL